MKGIVFNLLEQVVTDQLGEDAWEDALEAAGVEGAYTVVGTYSHEELHALVAALARATSQEGDDAVRWFGREALPLLVQRYPVFFAGHASARTFLLTLNDVIHPEVRKLFPGAYAPEFDFVEDADTVELSYESHRGLCAFAEGLVEGSANYYGESVTIEQTRCTKRGDTRCVLRCTFGPAKE